MNDGDYGASPSERDPYLPPPEVCDWLLGQEWSEPIKDTEISHGDDRPFGISGSLLFNHVYSFAEIGADENGRIFLPVEALELLKADKQARVAAFEKRQALLQADEERRKSERDKSRVCETAQDAARPPLSESTP